MSNTTPEKDERPADKAVNSNSLLSASLKRLSSLTEKAENKEQDLQQRFIKQYHTDALLNHFLKKDYTIEEVLIRMSEERMELIKKLSESEMVNF